MKSAICLFYGWTLLPLTGLAQDAPLPEANPDREEIELLGQPLFLPESVLEDAEPAAVPVDEPVSLFPGGNAGRRPRWQIEPHLQIKGVYDDNIFIRAIDPIADYVASVAPGIALGYWDTYEDRERFLAYRRGLAVADRSEGSFVALDCTAIFLGFSNNSELNTVNYDARLDGRWERGKLTLGTSVQFTKTLQPDADPGRLIILKNLSSALTSLYQFSPKASFGLGFYNQVNDPQGVVRTDEYVQTVEWRGEGFLNWAAAPRVEVGLGLVGGVLDVESAPNQTFERILARASYYRSKKLDAEFRGGVEFRQSERIGDHAYPIFNVRARWTPEAGSRVGLEGFRKVNKSIYSPETDYILTGFALTFERLMWAGLLFTVTGGYQIADYVGEVRTDHTFFVNPGLSYPLGRWGSIGVNYEYQRNNSDRYQSRYVDNRVTFEFALKF